MNPIRERILRAMQDPRVAELMKNPRMQAAVIRAFRIRGRIEGTVDRRLQSIAHRLNLATQKDLRTMHRRIRELERELREAEERLSGAKTDREAPGHS
jgi:polyhydroxyalkanoate synthesis regulator phasin